ncbi:HEAT repeat domain-containing protein [Anaerobacillus isosaccharinicus]|uniref:Esterase n=1 Tax=Anaerobacillus isosaccharinicus TaxID=1532552 RepID=A0A1S2MD29_9BACI|nr:HEAT repeat domain-containing protein [Anaerobacillus isosaccharinicus]MBA5586310.1 HEAT repeat domain-containing protein [Anaerobacillus isosaccharinicus]QOY35440.1 HEAT repeat domain-containing protein [Anaerobacillus isosaccharinicus]
MSNSEMNTEVKDKIEELKKSVNRTSNWRERLDAVEELGQLESKEAIALLKHSLAGDSVYKVQEAAYRNLKSLGEDVAMPKQKVGELVKGTNKILLRIKKSLPENHSYEDFKEKLKKMRLDLYDTYEGNKGTEFDQWLEENWSSLPSKK